MSLLLKLTLQPMKVLLIIHDLDGFFAKFYFDTSDDVSADLLAAIIGDLCFLVGKV